MLKVGIAGFGFMGRMHFRCWESLDDAQVVAIFDTNPDIREDAQRGGGNIAGAATAIDFSGIELFTDFDTMLEKAGLDAISLTLPTHLHAEFSARALAGGINVLCEKPMALNTSDCDRMIKAAENSNRLLQIGHCLRFWPEYAKAKELVDSGTYGKVVAATFQRLGAPPGWNNWFDNESRSGGVAMDLHIHDTDFVQYLFGMPRAVCSHGAKSAKGHLIHIVTQYLYGDDQVVTAEGGWGMMPGFGFEMSFNLIMEKATIVCDLTREPAFRVCSAEGDVFTPDLSREDGYVHQINHFASAVQGLPVPRIITLAQSRNSVRIVEAEKQSVNTRKRVELD